MCTNGYIKSCCVEENIIIQRSAHYHKDGQKLQFTHINFYVYGQNIMHMANIVPLASIENSRF